MAEPHHDAIGAAAFTKVADEPTLVKTAKIVMIYLSLRDLCAVLSLDLSSQRRRIVASSRLQSSLVRLRVRTAGGRQEQDFFLLDNISIWLMSVQERRVGANAAQRLAYVQEYLEQAVRAAFAALTGLPEGSSRQVEDLHDLERIDHAFEALTERQGALEQSQARARIAWRDLATQVRVLRGRLENQNRRDTMVGLCIGMREPSCYDGISD